MSGYYDRPVLKEPVWIWAVPAYFYAGGAAGAASVLGAAAQLLGGADMRGLVIRCRVIAAAGTAAGGVLLVYDLGRPERFLNMLRVFRPSSAMSIGSWTLAAAGGLSAASAAFSRAGGPLKGPGDAAGLAAGLAGIPLAGYTGVLLADTAVPLWQSSRRCLPWLFVASAVSSAGSLLEAATLSLPERKVVTRFAAAGKIGELAGMYALEKEASRIAGVDEPLSKGPGAALWKAARALTALSLAVSLLPDGVPGKRKLAAASATLGAIALRFGVFHAGKQSSRSQQAAFAMRS